MAHREPLAHRGQMAGTSWNPAQYQKFSGQRQRPALDLLHRVQVAGPRIIDDPVLEWVKGTGLRPILKTLADDERALFLAEYSQRLRAAYPRRGKGHTLYPFPRLFIVATR